MKGDKESRLSKLSYLIDRSSKDNIKFSLVMPNQVIRPDNSQQHIVKCLEAISEY